MSNIDYYYLALATGIVATIAWFTIKYYLYRRAIKKPFPQQWHNLLSARLTVYPKLNSNLQTKLQELINDFLYKKQFVGCQGLEINDEIKLTIAAEACLLILNRPSRRYAGLKWIYVYPTAFIAQREEQDEYGIVSNTRNHLLGESWHNGKVILAWDNVEYGIDNYSDGRNVVLHEFAHQLDQEDGVSNGAPLLYTKDSYRIWSRVFSKEFTELQESVEQGDHSLIDSYGATNAAEFFAVVTELFFERPVQMENRHPELFEQLKKYYRLDPREWQ